MKTNNHGKAADAKPKDGGETPTVPEPIQVLARFSREELDTMKRETGANADATAVACYVRKNLRRDVER